MYNGKKEDRQKMLDLMCAAIMEMRANGREDDNHIKKLQLITINEDTKRWWGWQGNGEYVRIVWSDSPERDDGYYDVYVDGDSAFGMFDDVWRFVKKHIG